MTTKKKAKKSQPKMRRIPFTNKYEPLKMKAELKEDRWSVSAESPLPEKEVVKVLENVMLEREVAALKERLAEQHVVVRELAMFTEGIILSEYVNGDDTTAYQMGTGRVSAFVERSRQLAQEA